MSSDVNKQKDKRKLLLLLLLLLCAGITVIFLALQKSGTDKTVWLEKKLQNSSAKTIEVNDKIVITKPIAVNGEKTITGTGTIIYKPENSQKMKFESYRIPEDECKALEMVDLSQADYMFVVSEEGSLTISGGLTLDADGKAVCVNVSESGKLTVTEEVVLKNGLGANILSAGELSVTGGIIQAQEGYNVMSNGTMTITGGEIIGSGERMMNIVANGTVDIKGGTISDAKGTNIYLLDGELTISDGTIKGAAVDNIFAEAGNVKVTGGTLSEGKHGVHNMGTAAITGGTYENNTSHVYNEGVMTTNDVAYGNSFGSNIVNTGKNAEMKMADIVIESATSHGVYNVRGAKLDAENLTVKSALAKGIHNGGGYFTGKDVTIIRASGVGVGNDIEKGWTGDGEVTIDGLNILKASYHSLTNANGVMTIRDAELGLISANCIQVTGGTLNIEDADIKGTSGNGTYHVFYIQKGVVNAEDVTIERSVSRGIQNRGGEFNGKNISISNTGGTAVGNMVSADGVTNGNITIDGLEISDASGYSIQNSGNGTIAVSNAVVKLSDRTAVRAEDGEIKLSNVEIIGVGTEKEATTKYGGITSVGGKVTLKDVKVTNMLARGISMTSGEIVGSGITIDKVSGTGIAVEGGTLNLSNVLTKNVTGYNVDVQSGNVKISNGVLEKSQNVSVHIKGGALTLNGTLVDGTPVTTTAEGETKVYEGILAKAGEVKLNNVIVKDTSGRSISNTGATLTGTDVTIENTQQATSLYNAGNSTIKGLIITENQKGYNVDNRGYLKVTDGKLSKTTVTNMNLAKDSTTVLNNVVVEGTVKDHAVYVKENATLEFDGLTIQNSAARALTNGNTSKEITGGTVSGKNLIITNATTTSLANDSGTINIDGLRVEGAKAHAIDVKDGSVVVKNGVVGIVDSTAIYLGKGEIKLIDTIVKGTTDGEAAVQQKAGTMYLENVEIDSAYKRSLYMEAGKTTGKKVTIKNGGTYEKGGTALYAAKDATVKISDLTVLNASTHAVDNYGDMELSKVKLLDGKGVVIYNLADLTLNDYEISDNTGRAIYNSGEVQLGNGKIDAGAYDAIYVKDGKVTLNGTTEIVSDKYAVNLTKSGNLCMEQGATLLSAAKVYLPEGCTMKLLGDRIGNTTAQKIRLAPEITEYGTAYVETTSEDLAKNLELANIFTVVTVSVVADEKNLVAAELQNIEYDEEVTVIEVSTWAEVKKAIESAEESDFLKIVLKNDIQVTDEGVVKQGEEVRVKVIITDEENGYKITRTDLENALFAINAGSEMILDGTLTLDGASSKEKTAEEAIILNKGTLTINSEAAIEGGYKSSSANTLDTSKSTCSAGAIENIGILNLYGTVTTSSSGNGSAISSLGGTLNVENAKLNHNTGRALRIVEGEATIRSTELNYNIGANGGGALLIDYADVKVYDSYLNYNESTGHGGAIQLNNSVYELYIENCQIIGNECTTSGKQGGGIYLDTARLQLNGCTVKENTVNGAGGGIRIGTAATLTLTGTTQISDNSAISYGTQMWVNAADATVNWGGEVVMSVTDLNVENDTVGMIGLNKPGVNICLTGAMKEDNIITIKAKTLVAGNTILSGYNSDDSDAEINTWIQNAADNFNIVSPSELKVGADGKVAASIIRKSVSTWAELKNAIENTDKGSDLVITLSKSITETSDAITVDGVKVTLTDNDNSYVIERSDLTTALFDVQSGSEMILDGKLTLDGKASSSNEASEVMLLNKGTLTINSNVTIKAGYKKATTNSLGIEATDSSGGAIESNGILNVYGTVTSSGSGAFSAISVVGGTFTANGANLSDNAGRVLRITSGSAVMEGSVLNNNKASGAGGAINVQNSANLTMNSCYLNGNETSESGGAIASATSGTVILTNCKIGVDSEGKKAGNTASKQAGALYIVGTGSVNLSGCTVANNRCTTNRGGAVRIEKGTLNMTGCQINDNFGKQSGGAFFIYTPAEVVLISCSMSGNQSDGNGQTVHIQGAKASLTCESCTINNIGSTEVGTNEIHTQNNPTVTHK